MLLSAVSAGGSSRQRRGVGGVLYAVRTSVADRVCLRARPAQLRTNTAATYLLQVDH